MNTDIRILRQYNQPKCSPLSKATLCIILFTLTLVFIGPFPFILNNSFEGHFFISDAPLTLPLGECWSGLDNYFSGLKTTNSFVATGWSPFITIGSVTVVTFFYAMTACYITRAKTKWTNALYPLFIFSMVVPSQVVMFPTVKLVGILNLGGLFDITLLYPGLGSGLSVFIFSGFIKSTPIEIEGASIIGGCDPLQGYFRIVTPMLKPVMITVTILNTMWVWNDYLLPYLVVGLPTPCKTIPVVTRQLVGSRDFNGMGAPMTILILVIIPIAIFHLLNQKRIIEGVVAGTVKG